MEAGGDVAVGPRPAADSRGEPHGSIEVGTGDDVEVAVMVEITHRKPVRSIENAHQGGRWAERQLDGSSGRARMALTPAAMTRLRCKLMTHLRSRTHVVVAGWSCQLVPKTRDGRHDLHHLGFYDGANRSKRPWINAPVPWMIATRRSEIPSGYRGAAATPAPPASMATASTYAPRRNRREHPVKSETRPSCRTPFAFSSRDQCDR